MPAIANPFGLSVSLDFAATTAQQVISGQAKLVTVASAPEGILLKRVSSFAEAIDAGGLYMYQLDDPTRWMFVVGTSLEETIVRSELGKVTGPSEDLGSSSITLDRRYEGVWLRDYEPAQPPGGAHAADYKIVYFGGNVYPKLVAYNYFTGPVGALAVVTGASCGYGTSKGSGHRYLFDGGALPAVGGQSYMATIIPMNVKFSQFMRNIRQIALGRVPENLKEYYIDSFEDALATYGDADHRPTMAVSTHWIGAGLANGRMIEPRRYTVSGAISSPYLAGFTAESSPTGYYGSNATYADFSETTKYRVMLRPGYIGGGSLEHRPYLDDDYVYGTAKEVPPATGKIEGVDVGLLRDSHVMYRSLVTGERYATLESVDDSFANFMVRTIDEWDYDTMSAAPIETGNSSAAEIEATAHNLEGDVPRTVTQLGTLPNQISRFSRHWDAKAQALAKSRN